MDYDILALLSFTENLRYMWPFTIGFMQKSWSVFEWQHVEKKCAKKRQKQVFSACEKGAFFSLLDIFGKMLNFAGLWCPNHLTYIDSWGIIGKIIFVSFIWYVFYWNCATCEAKMTSWKSGLILSALKMYIYIQCIKLSLPVGTSRYQSSSSVLISVLTSFRRTSAGDAVVRSFLAPLEDVAAAAAGVGGGQVWQLTQFFSVSFL